MESKIEEIMDVEEAKIVDDLIERAKRWGVSDNGVFNTISRVVANEDEEYAVDRYWIAEQNAYEECELREKTKEEKEEEQAWEVALEKKRIRGFEQVTALLAKEAKGKIEGDFGRVFNGRGVDREEMLVELEKIAPDNPALSE